MRLKGKRTIVTGAGTNGIGRAIAVAFAREGANVGVHYFRKRDVAEEVAAEIEALGRKAPLLQADIGDAAGARAMVRAGIEALGGIDVLVANAGMTARQPFVDITDEEFDRIQAVNLHGCFACCQEAVRVMLAGGVAGRIIVVSSINQDNVVPCQSHYCASKGGVRQLARAMALELAPHGINVNTIAPAAVLTDMVRDAYESDPSWGARVVQRYPKGRIGEPRDFEGVAVFLASEESAYITGVTVPVDGGFGLTHSQLGAQPNAAAASPAPARSGGGPSTKQR